MKFVTRRVSPWLAAMIAAVLVVGGGAAALALAPGTIHACVSRHSRSLYVSARCHRHDASLTWNTAGRRGPAGSTGPTGPTGTTGAVGPSNAFEAYRDGNVGVPNTGSPVTVATLSNLGPGAYSIEATTTINYALTADYVDCVLNAGGDTDTAGAYMGLSSAAVARATLPLQVTHTFTGTGTGNSVSIVCHRETSGGGVPMASQTKIVAVRLGSEQHTAVTG